MYQCVFWLFWSFPSHGRIPGPKPVRSKPLTCEWHHSVCRFFWLLLKWIKSSGHFPVEDSREWILQNGTVDLHVSLLSFKPAWANRESNLSEREVPSSDCSFFYFILFIFLSGTKFPLKSISVMSAALPCGQTQCEPEIKSQLLMSSSFKVRSTWTPAVTHYTGSSWCSYSIKPTEPFQILSACKSNISVLDTVGDLDFCHCNASKFCVTWAQY